MGGGRDVKGLGLRGEIGGRMGIESYKLTQNRKLKSVGRAKKRGDESREKCLRKTSDTKLSRESCTCQLSGEGEGKTHPSTLRQSFLRALRSGVGRRHARRKRVLETRIE